MPTPDEARRALTIVTDTAVRDSVAVLNVTTNIDDLLEAVPLVISYYSDGTAALAADHYDDLREAANASGLYTAEPIVNLRDERIRRGVLWAAESLLTAIDEVPDLTIVASRIAEVVSLETARPFRDTILDNQHRDPAAVGWRRHSSRSGCKFCSMLAARGAVYKASTARFASHPHCHCTAAPVFDGEPGVEASTLQYMASQRRRTESQRQALRDYLDRLPD